ncbi:site-2 protease family protein [Streptomyces pseudovenezuelae]|uniref:Zn-dependent protease n=1 Tax=Streptomyces pseudovenezuelae TaxID=67350 RepID=A0ABT6LKV0_9ACTN|nr:site-2 protease family protein [Streptomyces pseudovenezuelae]MDH6216936.1 Zn-dependent protease [Streptomyces pseudovenezuelae]
MDESGGSGQPRSGTDESADHHASPEVPAGPVDDRPTGVRRPAPSHDEAETDADTPSESASAAGVPASGDSSDGSAADDRAPVSAEPAGSSDEPVPASDGSPSASDGHAPVPDESAAAPDDRVPAPGGAPASGDHPEAPADIPRAIPAYPQDDDHPTTPTPLADGNRRLARSGAAKQPPPQRPEPRGGLLMGRPFGVPVYVAPSWFLVAALITWVFGGQLDRVLPELGAARYLVSLFFAVAFYASVLIHELAHTVAALRFKLPVRRIQLQFFGGVSEIEKEAETPGREFVLAFVGPLLSLVLSGIFYLAMQPVEPGTVPGVLLAGLMVSNLIVAAFNLLPGLPLDGGRMLRAVVWKITGRPMSGTIAAAWVGRALAVSVLIGLPLLTQSGALGSTAEDNVGMDTVTDALLAAILAAIIWTGAGNSLRMARLREHLPELRARNLTRRAVPVETNTPLSEALRRANSAGARALVIVDPEGTPLSLVREAAIVGVPEHRRPWVAVSGLAQDLTDGMRVSVELAGEDLLDALRATPATEYLVVEETGEIYGVLSAADVERAFVKAMARPS